MSSYFALMRHYSRGCLKLSVDYNLEDVEDSLVMNTPDPTPAAFINHFQFGLSNGQPEDLLGNGVGWHIVSPRISGILKTYCRSGELELIPLPLNFEGSERIQGFSILGVKKQFQCVDLDSSDILWSEVNPGKPYILDFRRCVLKKARLPKETHCFLISEYPVFPVLSEFLAEKIASLKPSGLRLEKLELS